MNEIIVILHNIRSAHNVGAILRSCDGFGVLKVIYSGYTPFPSRPRDTRLPHIHEKLTTQIHKTALGAELSVLGTPTDNIERTVRKLKEKGFTILALEQDPGSVALSHYKASSKVALVIGEEVHGIDMTLLALCDDIVEIDMRGSKESFNVSVAVGIALYQLSRA